MRYWGKDIRVIMGQVIDIYIQISLTKDIVYYIIKKTEDKKFILRVYNKI